MRKVIIQSLTTEKPISVMGMEAGICWGGDVTNEEKNYKRGLDCLQSGHLRTAEYPQVYMILDGYSARVIREFYTHIAGGPTRLQASTRYIDYRDFDCILPPKISKDPLATATYVEAIENTQRALQTLEEAGIPKEDSANLLPLGMATKVVVRTNLRNLIDMAHQRLCSRAYWEFRKLMSDILFALSEYSQEWHELHFKYNVFKAKCAVCGYCEEKYSCGAYPTKEQNDEYIKLGKLIKNKDFKSLLVLLTNEDRQNLVKLLSLEN